MSNYIEKNLLPEEKIIYRTKKNFIIYVYPVFWTIVIGVFLVNSIPLIQKIAFIPAMVALFYWVHQLLMYYFSEFAITNIRIMMREGFFFRHTNDTRLSAIANVTVNQSLLGQLLGYGTLIINSFGGERDLFSELNAPVTFQKQLQMQLYSLQKKV